MNEKFFSQNSFPKILFFIIFLIAFFLFKLISYAEDFNLAPSYILIDAKTQDVLLEKNSGIERYPASTTKIMTAIIALENFDLNTIITVDKNSISNIQPDESNIGIMQGENLSVKDLLNALLIKSANEAAYILANNMFSKNFIQLMNQKAKEIGALKTTFTNPSGIDNEIQYKNQLTTAKDLALIASYAMNNSMFREIVKSPSFVLTPTNKHPKAITLISTNKLLTIQKYKSDFYSEITGIKTGFTNKAGHNLVSSAVNKNGTELISVIMGVNDVDINKIFDYSKSLLEYGFKNFSEKIIVNQNEIIKADISIQNSNQKLTLIAQNSISKFLPNNIQDINLKVKINTILKAPIKKNQKLGEIEAYSSLGNLLGKANLISNTDINRKFNYIFTFFITLVVIIFLISIKFCLKKRRDHKQKVYNLF